MKALIILGAIVGFAIGVGFGLAAGSPWPTTLWRACAAALVATLLTRWWSGVWLREYKESLDHRHNAPRPAISLPTKSPLKS